MTVSQFVLITQLFFYFVLLIFRIPAIKGNKSDFNLFERIMHQNLCFKNKSVEI